MKDIAINIIAPTTLDVTPNSFLAYFPILNPINVKKKLSIAKTIPQNTKFEEKYSIHIPTEKLSKLTESARKNRLIKFKLNVFFSGSITLLSISKAISIKIADIKI